jgi:hypothetical protein
MNRTGRSCRGTLRLRSMAAAGLAGIGLAVAGCGGGGAPAVNAPPASAHTATEQAAVMNWLAKTNQMWLLNGFAAADQVSVGQMRTLYLSEERQASRPDDASRKPFSLTGLSITVPCHTGSPAVFVAYGDTAVFDLGSSVQSVAMVFERAGGLWKLAAAVNHSDGSSGWPALCTQGTPPAAPAALKPGDYTSDLARVLTRAESGAEQTTQTASPFAVNDFLAGPGSIPVQSATQIKQDRKGGVTFTGSFAPAPDPTFALPLASGRGYWVVGSLTQSGAYRAPSGLRAKTWPDGNQVATPRPAVVHHESDTFTTTYTAIDPLGPHHAAVTLDGFFGWPLTATAS